MMLPSVVEARPQWMPNGFCWYVVVLIRGPFEPWGKPHGFRTPPER